MGNIRGSVSKVLPGSLLTLVLGHPSLGWALEGVILESGA